MNRTTFYSLSFFFNDTATTDTYTLSLHDALPTSSRRGLAPSCSRATVSSSQWSRPSRVLPRSEEHTSELQSRPHLVCRLLLEKKKITQSDNFLQLHNRY